MSTPNVYSSVRRESNNVIVGRVEGMTRPINLPPGYRFVPRDHELIFYLDRKLSGCRLFHDLIPEVKLYDFSPQKLSEDYLALGEKIWYFFSPRDRKYVNGQRPNRKAGDGYWKATGKEKDILNNNEIVGFERALVYYVGKPPHGVKSDWIMHEYRLNAPPRAKSCPKDMKLDDCVLCKLYQKPSASNSKKNPKGETSRTNTEVEEGAIVEVEMGENLLSAQDSNPQFLNYRIPQNDHTRRPHGPPRTFVSSHDSVLMPSPISSQIVLPQYSYGQIANYHTQMPNPFVKNYHNPNPEQVPQGEYGMSHIPSQAYLPESSNARFNDYSPEFCGGELVSSRSGMIPLAPTQNFHQAMRNQHGERRVGSAVVDNPSPAFSEVIEYEKKSDFTGAQSRYRNVVVNRPQDYGRLSDDLRNTCLPNPPSSEEEKFSDSNISDESWTLLGSESYEDFGDVEYYE